MAELHAGLDVPLPDEIAVGRGTAVFVAGWCFHPAARIRTLELELGGTRQPVSAFGMPRLDLFNEVREPNSYASGFWGLVRISPLPAPRQARELRVHARLEDGSAAEATLGGIVLTEKLASEPVAATAPVVICMATHNPPRDLFEAQVDSIRAQTHQAWLCVISDDCSSPGRFAAIRDVVGDDKRFFISRSPRRLGFYRNFERALSMAPASAEYVAMADQDDRWDPDKLATLLERLGRAQLVYSDARIVARDGELVADTYWSARRNNHTSMLSLLSANAVTGAASLMRREVLEYALPFPPAQFAHYHDHWVALNALALGEIEFVERPLYDYVQHGSASLGHATANRMRTLRDRLGGLRTRSSRDRVRKWRMHYFVDIARLEQIATIIQMRCGERIAAGKRRELGLLLDGERSATTLATLARRGARELVGRPETLGAEWMLLLALVWRLLLSASARQRPQRRFRLDAVPPPDLAPGPERPASLAGTGARAIEEKIAPLAFELRDGAPQRINLLIPTVDLEHLFAGYIAKFNLALRLSERGARVRVVTTDPTPRLSRDWKRRLESYEGLAGLTDSIEFAFGRESLGIELGAEDAFIATTWWTAHIARRALAEAGGERFLYLIQEYEPFTFPMGTYAALARQSYELPHFALFSTELLRGWFRRERIGVYAHDADDGERLSASFQNAITKVSPTPAAELAARRPRRLLFYARPEPHAARNMFELGVLALSRAIEDGAFVRGWELHGVGTVEGGRELVLSSGARMQLLPRTGQPQYARLLREHDLGLALMYTPHPSLVPIEMASAGMLTVTNTYANKTAQALSEISSNLIAATPTIEGVAEALREAARGVEDVERRESGSAVNWSRDWRTSFPDALMERVEEFMRPQ